MDTLFSSSTDATTNLLKEKNDLFVYGDLLTFHLLTFHMAMFIRAVVELQKCLFACSFHADTLYKRKVMGWTMEAPPGVEESLSAYQ